MPKKHRKISKPNDISSQDIEAWIASNPDYRAILKEALIDYVTLEVSKKMSELEKYIKVQIREEMKKLGDPPEAIVPLTESVFLASLSATTEVFISRWKRSYQEPEIDSAECCLWTREKAKEEWINFFSSWWELGDLIKNRQAIRKVIAQIVEHYLTESFCNKLEGKAMRRDPIMRRLIMRDMLGE
ncbi:MAG: hypothetical protein HYV53_03135 [Parcubacteria group bacterium]|nr:hypothetical protein [Parcubacteria group bacterium]